MIQAVNVQNYPAYAKTKRPGYGTYLAAVGTSPIDALFDWHKDDGTTFWNYAFSGGTLFYSTQGTSAWTVCGNGTLTSGVQIGHGVLENTMLVGDGVLATRHTTNGTSFTDTTGAPLSRLFCDYQGRMHAFGTGSDDFYSTTGSPTDWVSDSSSYHIHGPGKGNALFKVGDRLILSKNSGNMFRWDGYTLVDLVTNQGPTSSASIGSIDDYKIWPTRRGAFGYEGAVPTLISNAVNRQFYNDLGTPIPGTSFERLVGESYKYDYYLAAGTSMAEDLTGETVTNCVMQYDYKYDLWFNHSFAHFPTAMHTFKDENGNDQMIFGDSSGQCYLFGGTYTSDAGQPIHAVMGGVLHFGSPESQNKLNYIWAFGNPGCQAHIQVALSDSFTKGKKKWMSLGDFSDGVAEMRFPQDSSGRLLFWRLSESSTNTRFTFYGFVIDVDTEEH